MSDLRCPKCGSEDLLIEIKYWTKPGSSILESEHMWEADSPTICQHCNYEAPNKEFAVEEEDDNS